MLSFRDTGWLATLRTYVTLLRSVFFFLYSLFLFLQSNSSDPLDLPGISLILAIAAFGLTIASTVEVQQLLCRGRTYLGLFANSRTLAIVRFRAPTLYIKRRDVLAVLGEGDSVRLRDGQIVHLAKGFADYRRYRSEFRTPFYKRWGNQRPVLAGTLRVEEKG